MMTKRDLLLAVIIGAGVGLFIQPVLSNTNAVGYIQSLVPATTGAVRIVVFLFFIVLAPLALAIAALLGRFVAILYQIAKFAAVGSLNSFIDLGIFNLIGLMTGVPAGGSLKFIVLKAISFLAATTNSYFWNKLWTFGDKSKSQAQKVVTFYLVTGFNLLVNVGVAFLVSAIPPIGVTAKVWVSLVAPVAGIFAGMAGNYLGYKFIVFKKPQTPAEQA